MKYEYYSRAQDRRPYCVQHFFDLKNKLYQYQMIKMCRKNFRLFEKEKLFWKNFSRFLFATLGIHGGINNVILTADELLSGIMQHSITRWKKVSKFLDLRKWCVKYRKASKKAGLQAIDETKIFFKKAISKYTIYCREPSSCLITCVLIIISILHANPENSAVIFPETAVLKWISSSYFELMKTNINSKLALKLILSNSLCCFTNIE